MFYVKALLYFFAPDFNFSKAKKSLNYCNVCQCEVQESAMRLESTLTAGFLNTGPKNVIILKSIEGSGSLNWISKGQKIWWARGTVFQ